MPLAKEHRFDETIEQQMRDFYHTLSEKDRRRYAAIEALKLRYVAGVLGCSENTIASGIQDIPQLAEGDPLAGRQRQEGAGRPKKR
jgi:hypothetical protein